MTLITGLVCKDSVVFAADSEESGWTKRSVKKVAHNERPFSFLQNVFGDRTPFKIVIAGAGNGVLCDYATQEIFKRVERSQELKEIETKIIEVLEHFFRVVVPLHPSPDKEFELLIGIWGSSLLRPALYSTQGVTLIRRSRYYVCGSGTLIDYILDRSYHAGMSTEEGIALAISMLQTAKKYVAGVGGESTILVLDSDGKIESKPSWEISAEENLSENYARLTGKLFVDLMRTRSAQSGDFEKALKSFAKEMKTLRKSKKKSDEEMDSFTKFLEEKRAKKEVVIELEGVDLSQLSTPEDHQRSAEIFRRNADKLQKYVLPGGVQLDPLQ
ncbi:MAG: hypothetical protein LAN36_03620 [Acidobacteriia bacterium]|nr:hypothetical protein [Terriglobia bacterium]